MALNKKVSGRIMAAVISSVMTAGMFTAPVSYQITNQLSQIVSAASVSVELVASSSTADDAPNKGEVSVPAGASEVTFTFTTNSTEKLSFGIYGLKLDGNKNGGNWWADVSEDIEVKPSEDGKGSFTYTIPSAYQGQVTAIGVGLWYPKSGITVTISAGGDPDTPGPGTNTPSGPQVAPKTQNTKSGEWSFVDNKDGTATISATLTSEIKINDSTQFDIPLTFGKDEEGYLDADGKSTYKDGDPINSHKFTFAEYGFETPDDLEGVTFQSFNYTITCDEEMDKLQYGGGINVEQGSPADTEAVKGKDGYWYNDQGDEDVDKFGDKLADLGIKYHGAYTVENAGTYAEIVWDVPKDVQPYVATNQTTNSIGIQYWYANALNPANEDDAYAGIEQVHLTSASCTYTKTLTVPYNTTKNVKIGKTLTPGTDVSTNQTKYDITELGLTNSRDKISAIKFNLKSTAELKKITSGIGISINDEKPEYEGWYMSPDVTILEPAKGTIELMWIVPSKIRDVVDFIYAGNVMYGAWYTDEDHSPVTLESIDFYEYVSNEKEDLVVAPTQMDLDVGETGKIITNIPGCSFEIKSESVEGCISVDANGTVTGVKEGIAYITVTSPEGQEATVMVRVIDSTNPTDPVTTASTTASAPTSTSAKTTAKPTTTVDPDSTKPTDKPFDPKVDVDWPNVLYGDVNLDTYVDTADLVMLNLYLLDAGTNPIENATARENAQCYYDAPEKLIDAYDSSILLSYIAMEIKYAELGPADKVNVPAIREG